MEDCNITKPRNVLFVFDEQNDFSFKTCMVENWRRLVINGEVLKDNQLPPVDATAEELPGIMEAINTSSLARVSVLEAQLAEVKQILENRETEITSLVEQVNALQVPPTEEIQ